MKYCIWKELKPGFWDLLQVNGSPDYGKLLASIDSRRTGYDCFVYSDSDGHRRADFKSMTLERGKQWAEQRVAEQGWIALRDEQKNLL